MYKLLIGIFVIGIAGYSIYFFSNSKTKSPYSQYSPTAIPTQNLSPTSTSNIDLGSSGSSYLDEKGIFSVLYPNDYILDTQDPKHIRVYKRGATQRPQSEMSDGALIVFETIDLSGKPLETWVNERIKADTADGTTEILEAKKVINLNSYLGYSYALRGLGSSKNIIVQKDKSSNNAVLITYSVNDPEEKGYQKEVDATLSSLKLLK